MKRPIILVLSVIMLASTVFICASCGNKIKKVGIFIYGPDPDTKEAYRGLVEGFREEGFIKGKQMSVIFRDCGGDTDKIKKVAAEFAKGDYDLVVPLTTPCLVAAGEHIKYTPVVFTSVYNPVAAGVASSDDDHQKNITGVYSPPPVEKTLELIAKCLPDVKSIGTIYNPTEANSKLAVEKMEKWSNEKSIKLISRTIKPEDDLKTTADSLTNEGIDAMYITGDNTVMGSFDTVSRICVERKCPLFINDPGFTKKGAALACGPDFYSAGEKGGILAARVLKGSPPGKINLEADTNTLIYVNQAAAELQGMTIPGEVLSSADKRI